MPKRNDRAAPPPRAGEWKLVFAENPPAAGWEDLCKQAPGPMREMWEHLARDPRDRSVNASRIAQLKHDLGTREVRGTKLQQWQYEVTGGGRVWYCPDDSTRTVWIVWAGCGHPKATDR